MQAEGLDELIIRNIHCNCIIGCNPEERVKPQPIEMTVTLYLDTREAAATDDLHKTVHYGNLCKAVHRFVQESSFQLIESLGEKTAELVLAFDERIQKVKIHLVKPQALSRADGPELQIVRCR